MIALYTVVTPRMSGILNVVRLRLEPWRFCVALFLEFTRKIRYLEGSSYDDPFHFFSAWRRCLSDESLGQYWAAVRDDVVVKLVSMSAPDDIDRNRFNDYASRQREALALLGELRSGELIRQDTKLFFRQRLSHKNRSRSDAPRVPKEFQLHPSVLTELERGALR